jgi:hypothetical protein
VYRAYLTPRTRRQYCVSALLRDYRQRCHDVDALWGLQALMDGRASSTEQQANGDLALGFGNRSVADLVPADVRLIFLIELIRQEKQP